MYGDSELIDPDELQKRMISGPGYARGQEYLVVVIPFEPGELPPGEDIRRMLAEMAQEATRNIVDMCKPRFVRKLHEMKHSSFMRFMAGLPPVLAR